MKKILTFGTFDLFHPGHKSYLEQAEKLGDELYICVARDLNVIKHKGKEPVWDEEKRKEEIKKNFPEALVTLGYLDDVYKCLSDIKPNIIALGYDQTIFTNHLKEELIKRNLADTQIVRLNSYKPNLYKTSIVKENR